MTTIDEQAIAQRGADAATAAMVKWEQSNRQLSDYERKVFVYAFSVGAGFGVMETREVLKEKP